jgi:hypothetical protein
VKSLYQSGVLSYQQGKQGSCTANCAALDRILVALKLGLSFLPSRAYIYIRERILHGWENEDSGAYMEDIGTVFGKYGVCSEKTMPYDENDYTTLPTPEADKEAADWKFDEKQEALHVDQIPDALLECQQNPHAGSVRFGIPVYESYMNANYNGGFVPVANPDKEELLGGHAQECLGKLDTMNPGYFIHAQSWGKVGDLKNPPYFGIFYYPYALAKQNEDRGEFEARTQQDNQPHPAPGPGPGPDKSCLEKFKEAVAAASSIQDAIDAFSALINCVLSGGAKRGALRALYGEAYSLQDYVMAFIAVAATTAYLGMLMICVFYLAQPAYQVAFDTLLKWGIVPGVIWGFFFGSRVATMAMRHRAKT